MSLLQKSFRCRTVVPFPELVNPGDIGMWVFSKELIKILVLFLGKHRPQFTYIHPASKSFFRVNKEMDIPWSMYHWYSSLAKSSLNFSMYD